MSKISPTNQEVLNVQEPFLSENTNEDIEFQQESSLKRCLRVDILSFVFGFGSWVAMTGLWVELPLLVRKLPEGPQLAASLSLTLQGANIGCFLYALAYRLWPGRKTEDYSIHIQMALGSISCFLLIFFWDKTMLINGVYHSVPLLVLSFGMSLVDCVSSVSFLPYMARFKSVYMTSYLMGEGMGGFIPSILALAQGIGDEDCRTDSRNNITNHTKNMTIQNTTLLEPRFSESVFMSLLLLIFLASWAAFALLNCLAVAKRQEIGKHNKPKVEQQSFEVSCTEESANPMESSCQTGGSSSHRTYLYLMFLQGWASVATFGIFPAIQPFSLIPYGYEAFHLCATLCGLSYPLACALSIFLAIKRPNALGIMTLVASAFGVFIFVSSLLSPRPPLYGTKVGAFIMVSSWVILILLFSYIKTMATVALLDSDGHSAMFWVGVITQGGGVLGAALMFLLVNVAEVFQDPGQCRL